ncbi:septal ring lytic transglycosylase RlpA family protein [Frigoriflavimonas asaccharolytica]|uniref:Probable endolytic peptidoglycan transglycosylase RlpA n=1 Tax=Frigoriflavimonas asaccharolytica TaxID=2735899 RepID=A0A8J8G636_9FLAO|nr:septal ring lytic transglycosylase RlpA family protein [Frigoriflavimonas asaccharolytica]NRS91701.1 rare lipoprotein A [Frigoriflavimonas asaccharolytica]
MIKKCTLILIMLISTLGISSFANSENETLTTIASYYHDKFNGRKTASGEIFNNSDLTAAHRSLPFGTRVRVTNLRNDKSVIVEINDRGPFHSSRALDLTKAAFDEIGNLDRGTMPIEYQILN